MDYINTPTSTYLEKVMSVTLDATGGGTAVLRPDAGQHWDVRLVQVGTRTESTPVAFCTLYRGAPETYDHTTFIDDTAMGSNDTSAIIAGSVTQYGEAISAVFVGGTPGDNATLKLFGVNHMTPPGGDQLPPVPGEHFFGKPSTEVITSLFGVAGGTVTALAPGASSVLTPVPLDMRQYQGFYLSVLIRVNAGVPINTVSGIVNAVWQSDVAGTADLYNDGWECWALNNGGAFQFSGDVLQVQDNTHGPYLTLSVQNPSVASNIDFVYNLFGTNHAFPGQSARQRDNALSPDGDGILLGTYDTIPNGVTINKLAKYGHGASTLSIVTIGQPNRVRVFPGTYAGGNIPITDQVILANTQTIIPLTLPKRGVRVNIQNTGAAPGDTQVFLINEYPNN